MIITPRVQSVLDRMAAYEATFSAQFAVDKETGEFLHTFVAMAKPHRILELGSWRGASAIYMADALQQIGSGHMTTVEQNLDNVLTARANIEEAGLTPYVTVVHQDAGEFLLHHREKFELVFIDAMKSQTTPWLKIILENHVHPRSHIIIDDVIKSREKMTGLFEFIHAQGFSFDQYQIGNGLLVIKPYGK